MKRRPHSSPAGSRLPLMLATAAVACFLLMTAAVCLSNQDFFSWDLAASHFVQSIPWPGFETLMRGVSLAGDDMFWSGLLVAAACLILLAFRAWREAVVLFSLVLLGQLLKIGIKRSVGRPRPTHDLVNVLIDAKEVQSFPSGHTVHYVVFFGFLWFLTVTLIKTPALRWPLLIVFGGMVLLVGPARIYLGAHWFSDVLAGYLLGGVVLAAGIHLYRRWSREVM